jgi:hypothetical protein
MYWLMKMYLVSIVVGRVRKQILSLTGKMRGFIVPVVNS